MPATRAPVLPAMTPRRVLAKKSREVAAAAPEDRRQRARPETAPATIGNQAVQTWLRGMPRGGATPVGQDDDAPRAGGIGCSAANPCAACAAGNPGGCHGRAPAATPRAPPPARDGGGRATVQLKREVGSSNDPLDREADRVAARVAGGGPDSMRGPQAASIPQPNRLTTPSFGGAAMRPGGAPVPNGTSARASNQADTGSLRGRGTPLPAPMRGELEAKFGRGLGQVRVHTGTEADRMSRQFGARAFTVGPDIGFRAGAYSPNTRAGRTLLAHELTHVAQQGHAPPLANRAGPPVGRSARTVRRQPDDEADDPTIAAELENEKDIARKNSDQSDNVVLRGYSTRVLLLLAAPHSPLRTEDDLNALLDKSYETANTELDTLAALGGSMDYYLGVFPAGFPGIWSVKVRTALSLGTNSAGLMLEMMNALLGMITRAEGIAPAIEADGLPLPMAEVRRALDFHLRIADAAGDKSGIAHDFAVAAIRFMQLKFVGIFAVTWEASVDELADQVADGEVVVDYPDYQEFVDNKQQILTDLPSRARDRLAASEEELGQFETDTLSCVDAAVGLGLSSALYALLGGLLGGWKTASDLFDAQLRIADANVGQLGDGEKVWTAIRWAEAQGYFGSAGTEFVDNLIANGPKLLAITAGVIIAQFIPGVNVAVDVVMFALGIRDAVKLIDALGSALSGAMNANSVGTLQVASVELARALVNGGGAILMVLITKGIGKAVGKLRERAAKLREEDPNLSPEEADRRALDKMSEEEKAPLLGARDVEFDNWKSRLSKADQEFLDNPANAGRKQMWAEMNPAVRAILTRCGSPCIPRNATPDQAAKIEALVDRLKPDAGVVAKLREFFHARRDVLDGAIEDAGKASDITELESLAYQDPVVPPGTPPATVARIGTVLSKFKFTPAEQAMLREYLQVRAGDLDAALRDIERMTAKTQLNKFMAEAAAKRAAVTPGTPAIPKGGGEFRHAIDEHGAQLKPEHLRDRGPTKQIGDSGLYGVPQGQWYNNDILPEVARIPASANARMQSGRLVEEVDMGRPIGRVYMPETRVRGAPAGDVLVISDVTWVRIIREPDGTFFNAFPITQPGVPY